MTRLPPITEDTTRKFPRTLNEAFGPYATGPLNDLPAPTSKETADRFFAITNKAMGLAGLALVAMALAGWLP